MVLTGDQASQNMSLWGGGILIQIITDSKSFQPLRGAFWKTSRLVKGIGATGLGSQAPLTTIVSQT